jgi:hypothetical protein
MSVEYGDVRIFDEGRRSVKITLSGDEADVFLGGNGKNGDLVLLRHDVRGHLGHEQSTIHLHGRNGDVLLGGNGVDGDIVLRNREGDQRILIQGGLGDLRLGGNGRDGDILLLPRGASNLRDPRQATISLNGRRGDLNLRGNIKFTSPVNLDEQLPGWSVDEGATAAFQGASRAGLINFVHSSSARGERSKLREIWIFNPELDDDSIVLLTAHEGAPCNYMVKELERPHGISGGEGHYINVVFAWKINPENRVRIKYYIIN